MSTEDIRSSAAGVSDEEHRHAASDVDEFLIDVIDSDFALDVSDEAYVSVLTDYVSDIDPKMMTFGWPLKTAKTSEYPYYKYDQSLLVHTRTGVFFLLRVAGAVLDDEVFVGLGDREAVLRELVALFIVHDLHKTVDSDHYYEEFDIAKDEIEKFVAQVGLESFAPELTIDDYHAVAVGLHRSDNSKHEMLTQRFIQLSPFLQMADGIASITDPESWVSERQTRILESAVGSQIQPHAHYVEGGGSLKRIINKAVAQALVNYGHELFTIHHDGCTFGCASENESESPVPADGDEFIEQVYRQFLLVLRNALPRYRNKSILSGATEDLKGQGRYHLSDLDILCLPSRDLIRAVVEKGISQADAPWTLPRTVEAELDALESQTDVTFDRSFRIEGVARLVHTVYDSFITEIVRPDSQYGWERNPLAAILAVFDVSPSMMETIGEVYASKSQAGNPELEMFPYKYLIAQDIIESDTYYVGESAHDTIETLTTQIARELDDFVLWHEYRDEHVGTIDAELRALVFNRIRYDGDPLSAYAVPESVSSYISTPKCECGVCAGPTTARQLSQPRLIEGLLRAERSDGTVEKLKVDYRGTLITLEDLCYDHPICYACQLNVEIEAAETSWGTDEQRIYADVQPKYAYTPLSGIIFSGLMEKYSMLDMNQRVDFARNVMEYNANDTKLAYEQWVVDHTKNAYGRKVLSEIETGFTLGNGYGGQTTSFPLPTGNSRESLYVGTFAAYLATAYSGLSAYLSAYPIIEAPTYTIREILKLGPSLGSMVPVFGTESLSLQKISMFLRAHSSIQLMFQATGHNSAPVSAFCAYKRNKSYPLVGSELLLQAHEAGRDLTGLAEAALHLNIHAAKSSLFDYDLVDASIRLGELAYALLEEPDDTEKVTILLDELFAHALLLDSSEEYHVVGDYLEEFLLGHAWTGDPDDPYVEEYSIELAYMFAGLIYHDLCEGSFKTLRAMQPVLTLGGWTTALALSETSLEYLDIHTPGLD